MENGKIECVRTPKTPEPIDTKFGVGDYVGDITGNATNASDHTSGSVWAHG